MEDAQAVAIVLRVLTRPVWTTHDLDQFDAYWRTAWQSALFGYEFEEARFRIATVVQEARERCAEAVPHSPWA